MIVLLAPSKSMNFTDNIQFDEHTQPRFTKEANSLVNILQNYSPEDISKLMNVNEKLAKLNFDRFQQFQANHAPDNARQAILAYRGDVYDGIDIANYDKDNFKFAQEEVRILTGLYGILRPLDLIQPYRLEMSTKLPNDKGDDLYQFWEDKLTNAINEDLKNHKQQYIINLASNEYFKALDKQKLQGKLVTPVFKENKNGKYKTIAIYAKKARGMMTDYIIRNRITNPEHLKGFDREGYTYNESMSSDKELVFIR